MRLCPFQNKFMSKPCNRPMLKNYNEDYCIVHGTMTFVKEAWDIIDDSSETADDYAVE